MVRCGAVIINEVVVHQYVWETHRPIKSLLIKLYDDNYTLSECLVRGWEGHFLITLTTRSLHTGVDQKPIRSFYTTVCGCKPTLTSMSMRSITLQHDWQRERSLWARRAARSSGSGGTPPGCPRCRYSTGSLCSRSAGEPPDMHLSNSW